MCGIFGIFFKENNRVINKKWVASVIAPMNHRGPDEEGIYINGNVCLGHKRLNIIDLNAGPQPVYNENRDVCVVFNGEIYNYKELRSELIKKGHVFQTKCDTEVIVHSYEEWRDECVNRLQGMFAFCVYNKRQNTFFLARDRIGIKPLYFYNDNSVFIFSSEIKPILYSNLVPRDVNSDAIDFYMSIGYVPAPETMFKGIYKLEPGYCLSIDRNGINKHEYWKLSAGNNTALSFKEASRRLEEEISECVRSHMMSDVPLGVFLSGGLDSSAVVGLMSHHSNSPVKTFSVGYKNAKKENELGYARIIADKFKTEHHEFILEPGDFFESINIFLHYSEEVIIESAAIALYQLSKVARQHVTVLLSGEGADELFGGYPLHWKMNKLERYHRYLKYVPGFKESAYFKALPEKIRKYIYWISVPFESRYKTVSSDVIPDMKNSMYTQDFMEISDNKVESFFEDVYANISDMTMLQKMLYVDTKYWLPDDLLIKADKMTMATSVELRVPFLDHKLVEFAFGLPDEYKSNWTQGKLILKNSVESLLPHDIIYRPKKGFPVPVSKWFSGELYDRVSKILLEHRTLQRGYFNKKYIEGILQRHKKGREDLSKRIFSLLLLELWHRMYIDTPYGIDKTTMKSHEATHDK